VCQKKDGSPSFFYAYFPYVATSYLRFLRKCFILQNPVQNESWSRTMKFLMRFMPLALIKPAPSAHVLIVSAAALLASAASLTHAQDRIYRCEGNEYTNNAQTAAQRGCKLVEGGNLTVVTAPKPRAPAAASGDVRVATATSAGSAAPAPSRIDTAEQRSRDSDARAILESELKKVEAKQAELLKEFNNGEPEKRGPEMRNNQMYLDRVAEMKAQIARNDSDIAGIKREIARTQPSSASR
jgi:uncharacterized protein (DUF2147 family)